MRFFAIILINSLILLSFFSFSATGKAMPVQSDPLDQIAMAIQAGNASALAKYFDGLVEITLDGGEGKEYSKAQAEQVIKDFFSRNTPSSFTIMHKGSSGGTSKFGIGTLETNKGNFRVNIFYKKDGNKYVIYKLKFFND